jgi:hypothetical protein
VSIDSSGKWWRGATFDDIAEYVHEYTADGCSADQIRESVCTTCGGKVFGLRGDQDAGAIRRTCRDCGKAIGPSGLRSAEKCALRGLLRT